MKRRILILLFLGLISIFLVSALESNLQATVSVVEKPDIYLISPPNNSEFARYSPELFEWYAPEKYYLFRIQVSQEPDFPRRKTRYISRTVRYTNEYQATERDWRNLRKYMDNRDEDGFLYWRVYAIGRRIRNYSDVFTFTIEDPSPPTLITPEDNAVISDDEVFSWNNGDLVTARIQVSCKQHFPTRDRTARTTYIGRMMRGQTSYTLTRNDFRRLISMEPYCDQGRIYWRIVGWDADRLFLKSEARSFTLVPPTPPSLINPPENSVFEEGTRLEWEPNDLYRRAEVEFSVDESFPDDAIRNIITNKNYIDLTSRHTKLISSLQEFDTDGIFYWRVRGRDYYRRDVVSEARSFKLNQATLTAQSLGAKNFPTRIVERIKRGLLNIKNSTEY